jgi:ubiquinone/menaquinone biosynthesis C-methylase UbiE
VWLHYDTGPEKYMIRGAMLAKWPPQSGEVVLDVGTGRGIIGIGYAKHESQTLVVCIDIWNEEEIRDNNPQWVLENARRESVADRVFSVTAKAQALPFRSGGFDRVVSSMCLHNIENEFEQFRAFQEISRVLRPGGVLVYVDGRWPTRVPAWPMVLDWLRQTSFEIMDEDDIVVSQYAEDRLALVGARKPGTCAQQTA